MTDIEFDRLKSLPLRDAWKHEAHSFTPWLAQNIDHISEEIGIPLEITDTEVAVEKFSADILARNPEDGSVVLIENQLERTDHTHLGQIMTYLAGLEAQTVIWIAPEFRQPHLKAIRWLNEHIADGFGFFAIKLSVVQIADSPFAPIFEVVAQPSDWERSLKEKRRQITGGRDKYSDKRLSFWTHYTNRHQKAAQDGIKPMRAWNTYFPIADGDVQVRVWIGEKTSGIYVRGGQGDRKLKAYDLLHPSLAQLTKKLGAVTYHHTDNGHVLGERLECSYLEDDNWDTICDWMEERRISYMSAIDSVLNDK